MSHREFLIILNILYIIAANGSEDHINKRLLYLASIICCVFSFFA